MDVPDKEMLGINMVEFAGQDEVEVEQQVQALTAQLESMVETEEAGVIGFQVCSDLASIGRIYNMRKKRWVFVRCGEKGRAKPVAFCWRYLCSTGKLGGLHLWNLECCLIQKSWNYGMFGHVDAGVLHVRPALDLVRTWCKKHWCTKFPDEAVKLVAKYGGLMWVSTVKVSVLSMAPTSLVKSCLLNSRRVKAAFDPHNKMNSRQRSVRH